MCIRDSNLDDTEIAFFEGDGLFLADVLAEQVNLALPMKVIDVYKRQESGSHGQPRTR